MGTARARIHTVFSYKSFTMVNAIIYNGEAAYDGMKIQKLHGMRRVISVKELQGKKRISSRTNGLMITQ